MVDASLVETRGKTGPNFELGLNARDINFDLEHGLVHKRITRLEDYCGEFNDVPDKSDYELYVGGSIDFLKQERWGLNSFIPDCSCRIEKSLKTTSGWACFVDMDLIHGVPLSGISRVSENVAWQLVEFLAKCSKMAEVTRLESGCIILPDLLGGIRHPKGQFINFIVENGSGKLWFVDVYPLAKLGTGWTSYLTRKRYSEALMEAAMLSGSPQVEEQAQKLKKVIA